MCTISALYFITAYDYLHTLIQCRLLVLFAQKESLKEGKNYMASYKVYFAFLKGQSIVPILIKPVSCSSKWWVHALRPHLAANYSVPQQNLAKGKNFSLGQVLPSKVPASSYAFA
ncbi:unnamed protein product [Ixodes persulcatus]